MIMFVCRSACVLDVLRYNAVSMGICKQLHLVFTDILLKGGDSSVEH